MSDSPFHLRQHLLSQAMQIANIKYNAKLEEYKSKFSAAMSKGKEISGLAAPDAPTEDEIISIAKKLYTFVKTK